jgi:trigger factor
MADSFNQPLEQIKNYYDQNKDKIQYFKHTLLEKRAIKLIIDNGMIEDVEPQKEEASAEQSESAPLDD